MAAATRASVAAQQQVCRSEEQERSRPTEEAAGARGPEEPHGLWRPPRTQGEAPGEPALPQAAPRWPRSHLGGRGVPDATAGDRQSPQPQEDPKGLLTRACPRPDVEAFRVGPKEVLTDGPVSQEAPPAPGQAAGAALRYVGARTGVGVGLPQRVGSGQVRARHAADLSPLSGLSTVPPPTSELKDEDFPSLRASTSSSCPSAAALGPVGLALACAVPSRGRSAFQEEDFPALVSSTSKPSAAPTSLISAWNSSSGTKVVRPPAGVQAAGGGVQPHRKAAKGGRGSKKGGPPPVEEEEEEEDGRAGLTAQELRSVPTAVAVSSLLSLASTQTFSKVGKKKKVGSEKSGAVSPPDKDGPPGAEQAPTAPLGRAEGPAAVIVNGHTEGPTLAQSAPKEPPGLPRPRGPLPCPTAQDDFPALGVPCPPRTPPPPGTCPGLRPAAGSLGRGLVGE